jgi:hypothetical protein
MPTQLLEHGNEIRPEPLVHDLALVVNSNATTTSVSTLLPVGAGAKIHGPR